MLSNDMQSIITTHSCGFVATIDGDGLPAVSPKATFLVVDDRTIACGNIRSPGTAKNLRANTACEVCFLDPLSRKAVRLKATGTVIARATASPELVARFEQAWADYLPHMTGFFVFDIAQAELVLSPAYDYGHSQEELVGANKAKMAAL
jgi:general stress protein 26